MKVIFSWSPVGKRHLTKKMIEHYIDICKMFSKRNAGAIFVNAFVDLIMRNGKIPRTCPVKKDFYYYHNVTLNGFDFPMVDYLMTDHDTVFDVNFLVRVKKRLISAFHPVLYGGYRIV